MKVFPIKLIINYIFCECECECVDLGRIVKMGLWFRLISIVLHAINIVNIYYYCYNYYDNDDDMMIMMTIMTDCESF